MNQRVRGGIWSDQQDTRLDGARSRTPSRPCSPEAFEYGAPGRRAQISALMDGSADQPTLAARVLKCMLYSGGHEGARARAEFDSLTVEPHRPVSRDHVKDFVFMFVAMAWQRLPRKEPQQAAGKLFLAKHGHMGQRQFIIASQFRSIEDS